MLEALEPGSITVRIDLTDRGPGTYQLAPQVILNNGELSVDAILPNTIEVTIEIPSEETDNEPTPTITPTSAPTPTP
jgi:hypothetical protein